MSCKFIPRIQLPLNFFVNALCPEFNYHNVINKRKLKPERNSQRYNRLHMEKALYIQMFTFGAGRVLCCYADRGGLRGSTLPHSFDVT
jgi:hypothetical protein